MTSNGLQFTFSDTIAGYVTSFDANADAFGLRTTDGRELRIWLLADTSSSAISNFGEPSVDTTAQLRDLLVPERYLSAYGIYYPESDGPRFEAKQIVFPAVRGTEYVFEQPTWWINEAKAVADFHLRGQFPDGNYDWKKYRTRLTLSGTHTPDYIAPDFRQETDTISRLVYGLASAYLLTGEDRFLEAAESGTAYLREHMRATIEEEGVVYWYHGIDVSSDGERKILASEFGDDFDAIPMYEQIYALAGPTQTYRVTGDPRILDDIDRTVKLFDRFYRDPDKGGYFSHIHPVTLDPRSDVLAHNRARKNWNSVGDHAPAYLINALLATGRKDLEDFLAETGNTIVEHFPDYDHSPFVQERFHEDWSHDNKYKWQQDRAVVGHNLKIAWNLMRMHHRRPNPAYVELANKIADLMPGVGSDQQRGGWYDSIERTLKEGQKVHRFSWHDRKAWWQQEQAVLAYLILAGSLGNPEHLRLARESAAFYNAMFLDHEDGGVYFNVLASGLPYLVGTERLKASHSMSGYHSIEICYLAAVYTNLLLTQEPLELHFRPKADSFPDGVLRVAPDLLPPGRVRLTDVWVNDKPYEDFDDEAMTVRLPPGQEVKVRVRLCPTDDAFDVQYEFANGVGRLTVTGVIDPRHIAAFRRHLKALKADKPSRCVLRAEGLERISDEAVRGLALFRQSLDLKVECLVVGANEQVAAAFREVGDSAAADSNWILVDEEPAPGA